LLHRQCPLLFDPLGFPSDLEYLPPAFGEDVYFDRDDVKEALHTANTTWAECNGNAFNSSAAPDTPYGDTSVDSHLSVLPRVIDTTQRVLIASGDYDMELTTLGTLLTIQNMTWGGQLGFQQQPSEEINLQLEDLAYIQVYNESGFPGFDGYPGFGQGIMGTQHYERGLMWATTKQCGHMQPQFQPRASYRHLQWLLGRIDKL
jgi:carboxypeptidase D